jgi:hypothetical protein
VSTTHAPVRFRRSTESPDPHAHELSRLAREDRERELEMDRFEALSYGIGSGVASVVCFPPTADELLGKVA